jgi:hypothetical protein
MLRMQVLMSIRHEDKEELLRARQEALAGGFRDKMLALERLLVGGEQAAGAATGRLHMRDASPLPAAAALTNEWLFSQ